MAETHDNTVQILMDLRDGIRDFTGRVDALAAETTAGLAAVHDELRAIDGIVTMLEKRDRETDEWAK